MQIRQQAYKFVLMPNKTTAHKLWRIAGSCRFLWNKALAYNESLYKQAKQAESSVPITVLADDNDSKKKKSKPKTHLNYFDLTAMVTRWKKEDECKFLAETPAQILNRAMKDLDNAFLRFFKKLGGYPRFKSRSDSWSFGWSVSSCGAEAVLDKALLNKSVTGLDYDAMNKNVIDQDAGWIKIPKVGKVRYKKCGRVEGLIKNITISHHAGKYYVAIQTKRLVPDPVHPSNASVGIDVGVVRFASLSDGTYIEPLNSFKRHEDKLAFYQRKLSRKDGPRKGHKPSKNWQKLKKKVTKIHADITAVRRDFIHKASRKIVNTYSKIVLEELAVKNMTKSAKGTVEEPGKNVAAKSGLNKSILDQGWHEFRRQLEYKSEWMGGKVIAVPPQNTSRTCSRCGHVAAENRPSQSEFKCVKCGLELNADHNAAMNILAKGKEHEDVNRKIKVVLRKKQVDKTISANHKRSAIKRERIAYLF